MPKTKKVLKRPPMPGAGRPPIADDEKRESPIKVLVSETEKDAIAAAAKQHRLTASSWLRTLALDAIAADKASA